ncbi:MAG: ribosome small subunit-dependent GTPase A [Lachnospiraceae bacterium]|nr:ribosome small subunit-dependent GTPase A [Lachnospiraceae bacterium]
MQGIIVKAIAGFYYVDAGGSGIYECRARGIFRKQNRKPLVGDLVTFEVTHEGDREGSVDEILPRKNCMLRPAIANVDQAMLLFAMRDPDPNFILLDRFLIEASRQGVPCVIAFNKSDLSDDAEREAIAANYRGCGSEVVYISVREGTGMDRIRQILSGRTTVLAGPSGAGKSSLVNALQDEVVMETGEISRKLSRGKNTTRHTQLIKAGDGTYLCDTPGFTALDTQGVSGDELDLYYAEFAPYLGKCYFQGCAHINEPDCAVKEALEGGIVSRERYDHYKYIYEELKEAERRKYR